MMGNKFGSNYPALARSRQREHVLFIAAGGLCFSLLVGIFTVFNYKSTADARQDVAAEAAVTQTTGVTEVLAPDRFIRSGTAMADISSRKVTWNRGTLPDDVIRSRSELVGMYARHDLQADQPIQRRFLTRELAHASLPLTPGNRAISINVDATSAIEGHALPGTRVDVLLTYTEDRELTTKTIVNNARVLSFGGDTTLAQDRVAPDRSRRGAASRDMGRTITLDVTPQDALKVQTGTQMGRLSLVMRSSDDNVAPAVSDFFARDLRGGDSSRSSTRETCTRGRARVEGVEYIVDCDGSLNQVMNSYDP